MEPAASQFLPKEACRLCNRDQFRTVFCTAAQQPAVLGSVSMRQFLCAHQKWYCKGTGCQTQWSARVRLAKKVPVDRPGGPSSKNCCNLVGITGTCSRTLELARTHTSCLQETVLTIPGASLLSCPALTFLAGEYEVCQSGQSTSLRPMAW